MTGVPEAFTRTTLDREGSEAQVWLDSLPGLVEDLLGRWGATVDGEPLHGGVALIVPVRRQADGVAAVLKVSFPHPGNRHEPHALTRWQGRGAVRLYERDDSRYAMLLERVQPVTLAQTEQGEDVASVAGALNHRLAVPAPADMPRLQEQVAAWEQQLRADDNALGHPLSAHIVNTALSTLQDLARHQPSLMVHGDLHGRNILRADREPWLAVDPKGFAGDPGYDAGTLLKSRLPTLLDARNLPADVHRILDAFVEAAELDRTRARRWAQLHAVQAAFSGRRQGFRRARSGPELQRLTALVDHTAEALTTSLR
ncbi:aminoglycoside phosphotransferase family protein [Streptomyces sp. NPDC046860]|uniref:aminoglycoside phosphotransferase family protein n=1 Tax=Streptomyces sp. NPDC046860 TaxID=3154495 RepID=UPI0033F25E45